MKSYVILEVFRFEIEQIIFSRFRNFFYFFFAVVNKIFLVGLVGKGETNNILILALFTEIIVHH
jgi:hypothetical protein